MLNPITIPEEQHRLSNASLTGYSTLASTEKSSTIRDRDVTSTGGHLIDPAPLDYDNFRLE